MLEPLSCRVTSPCGRYEVQFSCEGAGTDRAQLSLRAAPNVHAATRLQAPAGVAFAATLGEPDVEALTTSAGVVKDFRLFSLMVYNALLGKAPCLGFAVQTLPEIRARIAGSGSGSEPHGPAAGDEHTPAAGASGDGGGDGDVIFVLNYDVDFTRALFPIPLRRVAAASSNDDQRERSVDQPLPLPLSLRSTAAPASSTPSSGGALKVPRVVYDKENALELRIESLERENRALRAETKQLAAQNAALQKLSREKLADMTRQCEALEAHAGVQEELRHLRHELAEATRRMRDEQLTSAGLRREVDRLRARLGATPPRQSGTGGNRFSSPRNSGY